MFKVNYKNIRETSNVFFFIINFQKVNANWDIVPISYFFNTVLGKIRLEN